MQGSFVRCTEHHLKLAGGDTHNGKELGVTPMPSHEQTWSVTLGETRRRFLQTWS